MKVQTRWYFGHLGLYLVMALCGCKRSTMDLAHRASNSVCGQPNVGSNPTRSATSSRTSYRSRRLLFLKSRLSLILSLLLSAKCHAAPRLFACKRAHNASVCYQLFAGCACGAGGTFMCHRGSFWSTLS